MVYNSRIKKFGCTTKNLHAKTRMNLVLGHGISKSTTTIITTLKFDHSRGAFFWGAYSGIGIAGMMTSE